MGRRGLSPEQDSRWVFNRLAAHYQRRPPYPAALVARLAALAGAGPIADLGAGVGHLALPLAERGLEVFAVEPASAMLGALAARAGALPVRPVQAAAERTGLPAASFALVVIADALHWIDPEGAGAEIGRLLAPGGAVAVVQSAPAATPFMAELDELLQRRNPRRAPPAAGRLRQLLALAGQGPVAEERYLQESELDGEALAAVLRSLSCVGPALGPAALEELLSEAQALARRHGGARWVRELLLSWSRARPGSCARPAR